MYKKHGMNSRRFQFPSFHPSIHGFLVKEIQRLKTNMEKGIACVGVTRLFRRGQESTGSHRATSAQTCRNRCPPRSSLSLSPISSAEKLHNLNSSASFIVVRRPNFETRSDTHSERLRWWVEQNQRTRNCWQFNRK